MKVKNSSVAARWANGMAASNHKGTYTTDGRNLWSYSLLIGTTDEKGRKVLRDYTASAGHFRSMTTSTKHIAPARGCCDIMINPSMIKD